MTRKLGRSPTHPANQPPVTLVNTIITGVVAGVSEVVKHAVTRLEGAIASGETATLKPGEVLIIRVPTTWTGQQVNETYEFYCRQFEEMELPDLKFVIVVGDELAVQQGEGSNE